MTQDNNSVRLNKFLAMNGITSRRGADELVFAGRVKVNGTVADSPGMQVVPGSDSVSVDGKAIADSKQSADVTLILNKPIQTVTTVKDPQGRDTVMGLLPADIVKQRPFPVGRLDFFSEGLLIMTTDGELCHRLTHPKWHLPKVYEVTVRGNASREALETMRSGMTLAEGEKLAPVEVRIFPPKEGKQVLEMKLIQGINRQIRRMCRDLGLTILKLQRVEQGPIKLGNLRSGEWRKLSEAETAKLKAAVGLRA